MTEPAANPSPEDEVPLDGGTIARRLARVYAEALHENAVAQQMIDPVGEELTDVVDGIYRDHPDVAHIMDSLAVPREEKARLIEQVFAGRVSPLFANFLNLLNDHDRLELLPAIRAAYNDIRDELAGRVRILVRSATPLNDEQQQRLRDTLATNLKLQPILDLSVEPGLLGGLIVQIGDEVYDQSVITRLNTIRSQLLARSSYEIQNGRDRFVAG